MSRKEIQKKLDGVSVFLAILLGATLGAGAAVIGFGVANLIGYSNINYTGPVPSLILLIITAIMVTRPGFYDGGGRKYKAPKPPLEVIFWIELGLLTAGLIVIFCRPYGLLLVALLWG